MSQVKKGLVEQDIHKVKIKLKSISSSKGIVESKDKSKLGESICHR